MHCVEDVCDVTSVYAAPLCVTFRLNPLWKQMDEHGWVLGRWDECHLPSRIYGCSSQCLV